MHYPLEEKIGNPDLFVGREKEFRNVGKWLANIPKKLSKSRVILARRKSGKTAFVQRIFNQLWSEHGDVIPFYLDIAERRIWYPHLAVKYYRAFASQYISFLERDESLVGKPLSLEKIREYAVAKSITFFIDDVDFLLKENRPGGMHTLMWDAACEAPHRFAAVHDTRFLVMLDEFQNLAQYVYRDEACQNALDDTIPGSFHSLSESKIAPMLVTGSYVGWLLEITGKYLEAGRLSRWRMPPYLIPAEGLQATYTYAEFYDEPITNETAIQINQLCLSDPFFISCVMQSNYDDRDLTREDGVINTVNDEISDRNSEMSETWREYLDITLQRVNDLHAKHLLLHLNKYADRYWTHHELKDALSLDISLEAIKERLVILAESDMIERGVSDIDFRGLQDGTLNLILRNRFEKEINRFVPDLKHEFQKQIDALKKENRRLQGTLNNLSGQFAEYQLLLSVRSKKRFALSAYFNGVQDTTRLNIIDVKLRVPLQRENGKQMELDVAAQSSCGRIVVVEVKKWKEPVGITPVEDFAEKLAVYAKQVPDNTILPAFLALGGFTEDALTLCETQGIGTAERIAHF